MYQNPYDGYDQTCACQRTSFHTHAGTGPNTCGSLPINDVLSEYQLLKYGAVCISNHNLYTDPAPYQDKYELCLPRGYEYTMEFNHMVCVGTDKVHLESQQGAIDSTLADNGFVILCHPNWQKEWSLTKETIDSLHGFAGIEIYNGSIDCGAIRDIDHSNGRCNASNVYDYLLSKGRLCWCFGNDDFHRWWYLAITWNMIYAEKNTESIMDAVKNGAFYVSTGLLLEHFTFENNQIHIRVRNNEGFRDTYRYQFIGKDGLILKEVLAQEATYNLQGDEWYVRVEVTSSSGKMLYTQPIYDDEKMTKEQP